MLPVASSLVVDELETAFAAGADDVLLVNCGNIRPHVYALELVRRLWSTGHQDASTFIDEFAEHYFVSAAKEAAACLRGYFDAAIQYGPNDDDMAGDEFYHHPARSLVGHLLRGETEASALDLVWATGERVFHDQVAWFKDFCTPAVARFGQLAERCRAVSRMLSPDEAVFFDDFLTFQVGLHETGCRGMVHLCNSIDAFRQKDYPKSFVLASQSLWAYRQSLELLQKSEHGKWKNFFRFDWLTNVKITTYSIDSLRRYVRAFGDNPDYFLWYKEYLMPENEKRVHLENTHRNPPTDDDLAEQLRIKFGM